MHQMAILETYSCGKIMKNKIKLSVGDLFLIHHENDDFVRGILSETKENKYAISWFHYQNLMHITIRKYTKFEIESYLKLGRWHHHPVLKQ
jgi:hypothetical protein